MIDALSFLLRGEPLTPAVAADLRHGLALAHDRVDTLDILLEAVLDPARADEADIRPACAYALALKRELRTMIAMMATEIDRRIGPEN